MVAPGYARQPALRASISTCRYRYAMWLSRPCTADTRPFLVLRPSREPAGHPSLWVLLNVAHSKRVVGRSRREGQSPPKAHRGVGAPKMTGVIFVLSAPPAFRQSRRGVMCLQGGCAGRLSPQRTSSLAPPREGASIKKWSSKRDR